MGFFDGIEFGDIGVGIAEKVSEGIDQSVAQYQKSKERLLVSSHGSPNKRKCSQHS